MEHGDIMNEMLKNVAPLFDDMDVMIHAFNRSTYASAFQSYLEKHKGFFDGLNRELAEDAEHLPKEFSEAIIAFAKEKMEKISGKGKKENCQLNLNMFMATYFMPAILEGKQEKAQMLTDAICAEWAENFKGNHIKSADFATISGGFKSRLCYVTTAVCKSLHKPEDCYELETLRHYRDEYLMHEEGGRELVEKYYDIAPTIVKRIDKTADADEKYRYIWENYLKPCIMAIENGKLAECRETYIDMVEELQDEYMITDVRLKK